MPASAGHMTPPYNRSFLDYGSGTALQYDHSEGRKGVLGAACYSRSRINSRRRWSYSSQTA
jgi:hypothetical protein